MYISPQDVVNDSPTSAAICMHWREGSPPKSQSNISPPSTYRASAQHGASRLGAWFYVV